MTGTDLTMWIARRIMVYFAVAVAAGVVMAGIVYTIAYFTIVAAFAHDHKFATANPNTAQWYGTLKTKGGTSCCGEADCRPTEAEERAPDEWWALVRDYSGKETWTKIPPEKVIQPPTRITGSAYICNSPGTPGGPAHVPGGLGTGHQYIAPASPPVIFCFVPPPRMF